MRSRTRSIRPTSSTTTINNNNAAHHLPPAHPLSSRHSFVVLLPEALAVEANSPLTRTARVLAWERRVRGWGSWEVDTITETIIAGGGKVHDKGASRASASNGIAPSLVLSMLVAVIQALVNWICSSGHCNSPSRLRFCFRSGTFFLFLFFPHLDSVHHLLPPLPSLHLGFASGPRPDRNPPFHHFSHPPTFTL